jgi:hypothetical protein
MLIGQLNILCVPISQTTAGPNGRRKPLTRIIARMGKTPIAERTIPGKWSIAEALKEFRRFPERFMPAKGWTAATIASIAA